jgi:hypothetical protein
VHLEASTQPHVHQNFEIFWTNNASTMAWPNLKNGPKNGLGPLGVKKMDFWPSKLSCPPWVLGKFFLVNIEHYDLTNGKERVCKIWSTCRHRS